MTKTYEAPVMVTGGNVVASTESGIPSGPFEGVLKSKTPGSVGFAL